MASETTEQTEKSETSSVKDEKDKETASENKADSGSVSTKSNDSTPDYKSDFSNISKRLDALETTLSNLSGSVKTPDKKAPTTPKNDSSDSAQPSKEELDKITDELDL